MPKQGGAPRQSGKLTRSLGLWAIVALGLGYMTPTVVFDTFGIVSEMTEGSVPMAYIVALVVMLFTAISYGKMTRAFPSAGSAYTYVRESIHPNVGFMVGWTSLMDYLLLPMVNALIIRLYMEQMFPDVPKEIFVIVYVIAVTAIVYFSMRGTSSVNGLLLTFAIVIIIVFIVMVSFQLMAGEGQGTLVSARPFVHEGLDMGMILAAATIVCFSFIGFDAITMYTEEAKDARIMPKAITLTVLLGGLIFLAAGYFAQLRFPDNTPFGEFTDDPLPQIGLIVGGQVFQTIFVTAGFVATMASGLASHASVSRMLLVMGRNNVIPRRFFGYISPKTHTPTWNIILVGVVSLAAMEFSLEIIASLINFGALIAFTFVNLTVIAHYAIRQGRRKTPGEIFTYIVMPGVGALLTGLLWVNLDNIALIGGVIWLAAGIIYLAVITKGFRTQPDAFDEAQPVTGFNKTVDEEAELAAIDGEPEDKR
ncbi:APC family permease [Gulosibacter macacae]|uniref:APC family permease n=2 Tax=Gulosibacter macacae TaxID=2488791 RepID=A0A3P3VYK5_9MICO|nr:APC family permease [Gulosibacter macacae]RRJ85763.1 APC family permease [Gulosibacter macacae]